MPRYARDPGLYSSDARWTAPELPSTCPWPKCWQRSAGQDPAKALCEAHLGRVRLHASGCAWQGCPQPTFGDPFCSYHGKLCAGLIDPVGHDDDRQAVLLALPRR